MKTQLSFLIATVVVGLSTFQLRAADTTARDELENRIERINHTTDREGHTKPALQQVATETGVPFDRVQAMHREHPGVGVAGILIANVLADDTKKQPEQFMESHSKGKKWAEIAEDNKVPVSQLNTRLDRFEKQLATQGGEKKK